MATVMAESTRIHENTLTSLLSVMCDAVVHLDKDLCFSKPCPQLGTLLLRQLSFAESGGDLNIMKFVGADDHVRFRECLCADVGQVTRIQLDDSFTPQSTTIPARTVRIRMVGSS